MAANRFYSNTAQESALSGGIAPGTTSFAVSGVAGYPVSFPFTLIIDPETASEEAISVTNVAGTTLTVTRGQDNTVAVSHNAGAKVIHAHTARDFAEPQDHLGASSGVHGVVGNVVGTSDSQALTNKDLTSATNTLPTTVVKTTTAQVLTNKDMTSGTNTFPNTLVTLTGSQILTNKTIQDPTYTIESKVAEGVITCTSSTRPTHREGRLIYETDTDTLLRSTGSSWTSAGLRAGSIIPFAGAVTGGGTLLPGGFYLCDFTAVSRTGINSELFAEVGITWGPGNGSTTFNLPPFESRMLIGAGTFASLGTTDGKSEVNRTLRHTHPIPNEAAHNHPITSGGGHTHGLNTNTDAQSGGTLRHVIATSTQSDGAHDHGGNTGNGGSHSHGGDTNQSAADALPYGAINWLIKI